MIQIKSKLILFAIVVSGLACPSNVYSQACDDCGASTNCQQWTCRPITVYKWVDITAWDVVKEPVCLAGCISCANTGCTDGNCDAYGCDTMGPLACGTAPCDLSVPDGAPCDAICQNFGGCDDCTPSSPGWLGQISQFGHCFKLRHGPRMRKRLVKVTQQIRIPTTEYVYEPACTQCVCTQDVCAQPAPYDTDTMHVNHQDGSGTNRVRVVIVPGSTDLVTTTEATLQTSDDTRWLNHSEGTNASEPQLLPDQEAGLPRVVAANSVAAQSATTSIQQPQPLRIESDDRPTTSELTTTQTAVQTAAQTMAPVVRKETLTVDSESVVPQVAPPIQLPIGTGEDSIPTEPMTLGAATAMSSTRATQCAPLVIVEATPRSVPTASTGSISRRLTPSATAVPFRVSGVPTLVRPIQVPNGVLPPRGYGTHTQSSQPHSPATAWLQGNPSPRETETIRTWRK